MADQRTSHPRVPPGLPSLVGLLTAAALLVTGIWILAGIGWAILGAAPAILAAGLGVEHILDDTGPPAQTGGPR